jgi:gluconolactonase
MTPHMPSLRAIRVASFAAFFAALTTSSPQAQIFAPDAKLEKLAGGFKFTEGAASDTKGNVYFTDQPNDSILVWTTEGKLATTLKPTGRSNGLCVDANGHLWACADEKFQLRRIEPAIGRVHVVLGAYEGRPLNGPNDVWLRADGSLYFTDPYYQRDYWARTAPE